MCRGGIASGKVRLCNNLRIWCGSWSLQGCCDVTRQKTAPLMRSGHITNMQVLLHTRRCQHIHLKHSWVVAGLTIRALWTEFKSFGRVPKSTQIDLQKKVCIHVFSKSCAMECLRIHGLDIALLGNMQAKVSFEFVWKKQWYSEILLGTRVM